MFVPSILIFYIVFSAGGSLGLCEKIRLTLSDNEDLGSPLFLTPYIESGKLEEGRNLSKVNLPGLANINSYAGFFTVDQTFSSNHFLWYFPTMSESKGVPIILWLNGGPGSSSLNGLFDENGPLIVKNKEFQLRKHHWTLNHHLIYIDNPVGVGFSFTNDSRGFCTNQTQIAEQLYTTLIQFFQLFPDLQQNDFIVSGVSYAGKYVPALAYAIHKKNPSAKIKINMKGLTIGDGWCDPTNQLEHSDHLYQIGLMDWNQKTVAEGLQNQIVDLIKQTAWLKAYNAMGKLLDYLRDSIGNVSLFNYLESSSTESCDYCNLLLTASIRKAIHVGDLIFNDGVKAHDHLKEDIMQSVAPWISELLDHYHVLIYNGQLDTIVAYPLTVNFLRNLKFSGSEEYQNTPRIILKIERENEKELVGYMKRAGNLIEVMIRNAGHKVTKEQPYWTEALISWFSSGANSTTSHLFGDNI